MWLLDPKSGTKGRVARMHGNPTSLIVKARMKLAAALGDSRLKIRIDEIRRDAAQREVGPLPSSTQFDVDGRE